MKGFNRLFAGVLAGHSSTQSFTGKPVTLAVQDVVPGVVPTAPGPSDVFREGKDCTLSWSPDPAGVWKETNVELMSGDNWNMVHITTITTFDGTDASQTSFSYPCPDVTPNSAIYFYQFSSPAAPKNLTWTTRFTIAAADGSTTPPANDTQPDGQKIPWGVGALEDPSKAVAAPSYLGGGAASVTGSGSASASATTSHSSIVTSFSDTTLTPDGDSTTTSGAAATTVTDGDPTTTSSKNTVTQTQTATQSAPSTTGSATGGNGNGAISVQTNVMFGTVAMALTALVFGVIS